MFNLKKVFDLSNSVIDYNHCFCINFVPAELIMKIKRTMICVQSIIIMHSEGFSKLYLIIVLTKYLCTTISQRRNLKFSIMGIKMIILTSQLFPGDHLCPGFATRDLTLTIHYEYDPLHIGTMPLLSMGL